MYRKDFIDVEIQKLSQVLAKVLGLKREGEIEEAHESINIALLDSFKLDENFLNTASPKDLEVALDEKNISEEKMNILAQMLFESVHPFENNPEINNRLHLVLTVLSRLERDYHVQSLDNIAKRQMIDRFLNIEQYE